MFCHFEYLSKFLIELGGIQVGGRDDVFGLGKVKHLDGHLAAGDGRPHLVLLLVGGVLPRLRAQAQEVASTSRWHIFTFQSPKPIQTFTSDPDAKSQTRG